MDAADECAMCGACVGVCPAYLMTKDERVTARGKLLTARKMGSYGAVTAEHAHVTFLCMRCKACEQVCQSKLHLIPVYEEMEKRLAEQHGRDDEMIKRFVELAWNSAASRRVGRPGTGAWFPEQERRRRSLRCMSAITSQKGASAAGKTVRQERRSTGRSLHELRPLRRSVHLWGARARRPRPPGHGGAEGLPVQELPAVRGELPPKGRRPCNTRKSTWRSAAASGRPPGSSTIWNKSADRQAAGVRRWLQRHVRRGPGYDSMWTDMSEIVRPTRDGIHGREYISTSVDLGKRVDHLEFDEAGGLLTEMPKFVELPLPMMMDVCRSADLRSAPFEGLIKAADTLGTLLFFPAGSILPDVPASAIESLVRCSRPAKPRCRRWRTPQHRRARDVRPVEGGPGCAQGTVPRSHRRGPGRGRGRGGEGGAWSWSREGSISSTCSMTNRDTRKAPSALAKDSLLAVNKALANESMRESVSIIASGAVLAAAEHVPKSLICGADAVVLELALKV